MRCQQILSRDVRKPDSTVASWGLWIIARKISSGILSFSLRSFWSTYHFHQWSEEVGHDQGWRPREVPSLLAPCPLFRSFTLGSVPWLGHLSKAGNPLHYFQVMTLRRWLERLPFTAMSGFKGEGAANLSSPPNYLFPEPKDPKQKRLGTKFFYSIPYNNKP